MRSCKDINNSLPLYEDNLLSETEKKSLEEHLKSCPECSRTLAQLQKIEKIVQELNQVEPPAWFKQKIMARIRDKEKKSFAQKWFYPLRIKIPVQILATIVIAVLAVYIYRAGDEQFKEVLPLVVPPATKAEPDQKPAELPKLQSVAPEIGMQKNAAVSREKRESKEDMYDAVAGGGKLKTAIQENRIAIASDSASAGKQESSADKKDSQDAALSSITTLEKQAELQAKQEAPKKAISLRSMEKENKSEQSSAGFAQKSKLYKAAAPAAPQAMAAAKMEQSQQIISVLVQDLNTAVKDVEKILARYDARIISGKLLDGRIVVQTDVSGKYLKDILSELKVIGQVEEKVMPEDGGKGSISVIIEIKSK